MSYQWCDATYCICDKCSDQRVRSVRLEELLDDFARHSATLLAFATGGERCFGDPSAQEKAYQDSIDGILECLVEKDFLDGK